jgi:hypothetical protein
MSSQEDDDYDRPRRRRYRDYDHPPSGNNSTKVLLIVLGSIAILGFLCVGGCVALMVYGAKQAAEKEERERRDAEDQKKTPIVVPAEELIAEYKANEIAADTRFKNKWVRVSGTIKRIGKDIWDEEKIALHVGSAGFDPLDIKCLFGPEHTNEVSKLKVGDTITILGRCRGNTLDINLVDCEFVK